MSKTLGISTPINSQSLAGLGTKIDEVKNSILSTSVEIRTKWNRYLGTDGVNGESIYQAVPELDGKEDHTRAIYFKLDRTTDHTLVNTFIEKAKLETEDALVRTIREYTVLVVAHPGSIQGVLPRNTFLREYITRANGVVISTKYTLDGVFLQDTLTSEIKAIVSHSIDLPETRRIEPMFLVNQATKVIRKKIHLIQNTDGITEYVDEDGGIKKLVDIIQVGETLESIHNEELTEPLDDGTGKTYFADLNINNGSGYVAPARTVKYLTVLRTEGEIDIYIGAKTTNSAPTIKLDSNRTSYTIGNNNDAESFVQQSIQIVGNGVSKGLIHAVHANDPQSTNFFKERFGYLLEQNARPKIFEFNYSGSQTPIPFDLPSGWFTNRKLNLNATIDYKSSIYKGYNVINTGVDLTNNTRTTGGQVFSNLNQTVNSEIYGFATGFINWLPAASGNNLTLPTHASENLVFILSNGNLFFRGFKNGTAVSKTRASLNLGFTPEEEEGTEPTGLSTRLEFIDKNNTVPLTNNRRCVIRIHNKANPDGVIIYSELVDNANNFLSAFSRYGQGQLIISNIITGDQTFFNTYYTKFKTEIGL